MPRSVSFKLSFRDGTTQQLDEISDQAITDGFVTFYGHRDSVHTAVLAIRSDLLDSFQIVPPAEKEYLPANLYRVTLNDGTTKVVPADLYRVATYGRDGESVQVYEFFTRTDSSSREELTIPYPEVRFVERVDAVSEDAASKS